MATFLLSFGPAHAQPFIDLFTLNAMGSVGLYRAEVSATLPVPLDTNGRLLVVDPYFVQWRSRTDGSLYQPERSGQVEESMRGSGGALTYVHPFAGGRWKLATAAIGRYHWLVDQRHGDIQYGGVVLASRVLKPSLALRLGAYANYDAFGWFVIPLFGIDWRIDARHNLFGILPGSLNYEHKLTPRFSWGASFRAYTTSFGVRTGEYRRIDENPLGLFADLYFARQVVLRLEGGWCFYRDVLGGKGDPLYRDDMATPQGYADHRIADAPYARIVLAYRLRLDS
jgi:hypothetical protein